MPRAGSIGTPLLCPFVFVWVLWSPTGIMMNKEAYDIAVNTIMVKSVQLRLHSQPQPIHTSCPQKHQPQYYSDNSKKEIHWKCVVPLRERSMMEWVCETGPSTLGRFTAIPSPASQNIWSPCTSSISTPGRCRTVKACKVSPTFSSRPHRLNPRGLKRSSFGQLCLYLRGRLCESVNALKHSLTLLRRALGSVARSSIAWGGRFACAWRRVQLGGLGWWREPRPWRRELRLFRRDVGDCPWLSLHGIRWSSISAARVAGRLWCHSGRHRSRAPCSQHLGHPPWYLPLSTPRQPHGQSALSRWRHAPQAPELMGSWRGSAPFCL